MRVMLLRTGLTVSGLSKIGHPSQWNPSKVALGVLLAAGTPDTLLVGAASPWHSFNHGVPLCHQLLG